jgi:hypothetical protein
MQVNVCVANRPSPSLHVRATHAAEASTIDHDRSLCYAAGRPCGAGPLAFFFFVFFLFFLSY